MRGEKRTDGRKSQTVASNKYAKSNYDRIIVTIPKGEKESILSAASAQGCSINNYIVGAVSQRAEREGHLFERLKSYVKGTTKSSAKAPGYGKAFDVEIPVRVTVAKKAPASASLRTNGAQIRGIKHLISPTNAYVDGNKLVDSFGNVLFEAANISVKNDQQLARLGIVANKSLPKRRIVIANKKGLEVK